MVTRFREKIALAVFFGLIILGFCSLVGYLMLGHSWNVAATNIDDATGSLKGYTVIVFEGITLLDPDILSHADSEEDPDKIQDEKLSQHETDDSTDSPILHDEAISSLHEPDVEVEDVKESYREKNSAVVTLDIIDFNKYTDGLILKKGNHRFGVFSVNNNTSKVQVRQTVTYLENHDVDFILAITDDKTLLEKTPSIDIVISTNQKNAISSDEALNNAFYVSVPNEGSVGVILISPSGVVSTKVLNEI